MNKYKIYAGSLILAFGLCAAMPVGAQNKKNKKKNKKKNEKNEKENRDEF